MERKHERQINKRVDWACRASFSNEDQLTPDTDRIIIDGLAVLATENDYDMSDLWEARSETRSLKLMILYGIRGLATELQHAAKLGHTDEEINHFLYKGLFAVGGDSWDKEDLLAVMMELGDMIVRARALLSC